MKSFLNSRDTVVVDAIDGFLMSSGAVDLCRLDDFPDIKVVLRSDWDRTQVALVSGGGSGHEPAHAGFVGGGMLTAAVCGEVFASPSVDAVLAGILAVTGDPGCLLIVKNYTGDRLNFGLAAERARAMGLKVELVIVGDDVALPGARQPRGIAGTLFVHKLAGAAASAGRSLAEVKAVAEDAAAHIHSLGLSLSTCSMPGVEPQERLAADQVELGLGIHGEPGARVVPMASADTLIAVLADTLEAALEASEARYALMLNTLGGVPPLEMALVTKALAGTSLMNKVDYIMGPAPMMTALDMRGVSLSVIALDADRLRGLQAPVKPAAWLPPKRFARPTLRQPIALVASAQAAPSNHAGARAVVSCAVTLFETIAPEIDALDAKVGDGDTGSTFAGAARAIAGQIDRLPFADGAALLRVISDVLLRNAGGSSGVLLATFFAAASTAYADRPDYPKAFLAGLDKLKVYGGAQLGDRTMIDALQPALQALARTGSVEQAAIEARVGADRTAHMLKAGSGRSAYVRADALEGITDPGAEAVARLLEAIARRQN
ncbi:dihydroxyacetone kinase subunit DhaK [Lichenifustis flavocetrariae]|uniref:Dihydroxyacetone kinase subunit DhaK n=1 Tax=Lichenifustis flavocetrariae TaxID=2949735 RepID=A0AA42CNA6_9HYPH|nr:dihydroxyacetone kinase subunit DhaK [Lichenifustis flavocetrariae]MCW6509185.1 dihydroxyacetone kinase subunit DhaK [Lichenifustis flavocetrariae]